MPPAPGRPRRHLAAAIPAALAALAGLAAFAAAGSASAAEVYFQAGLPGVGLGFAQPLNPWAGVRGDFVTLGSRDRNGTEEGITPKAA